MTEEQLNEIEARAMKARAGTDEGWWVSGTGKPSINYSIRGAFVALCDDADALIAVVREHVTEARRLQVALNDTLEALHERQNCDICNGAGGYYQSVGAEGEDVSWEECECADFAEEILEKYNRAPEVSA